MGIMTQTRNSTKAGFTIVELLIVIVVIAILAVITIVAFNGIQAQAKNTRMLAAMDTYEKVLRMYKEQYGHYPPTPRVAPQTTFTDEVCLGEATHYPETSEFIENACQGKEYLEQVIGPTHVAFRVSETVNSELKKLPTRATTVHRTRHASELNIKLQTRLYSATGIMNTQ